MHWQQAKCSSFCSAQLNLSSFSQPLLRLPSPPTKPSDTKSERAEPALHVKVFSSNNMGHTGSALSTEHFFFPYTDSLHAENLEKTYTWFLHPQHISSLHTSCLNQRSASLTSCSSDQLSFEYGINAKLLI